MLNKRGQEAAPFELLIAVIIMGFVIIIGAQAMLYLQDQKCKGDTDRQLQDLKLAFEGVKQAGRVKHINFRLSGCYQPEEEQVWIEDESGLDRCIQLGCGDKRLCPLLKYQNKEFSRAVCLEIKPSTVFPSEPTEKCPKRENMHLVDFENKEGKKHGNYMLQNNSEAGEAITTICAYRREG